MSDYCVHPENQVYWVEVRVRFWYKPWTWFKKSPTVEIGICQLCMLHLERKIG